MQVSCVAKKLGAMTYFFLGRDLYIIFKGKARRGVVNYTAWSIMAWLLIYRAYGVVHGGVFTAWRRRAYS